MMSSQIYSNDTRKYYALPGMNAYLLTEGLPKQVFLYNVNTLVDYNRIGFVQGPDLVDVSSGAISVLEDGMYSITSFVELSSESSAIDVHFQHFFSYASSLPSTGTVLNLSSFRIPAIGGGLPAVSTVSSLTWTGFLQKGDIVGVRIINLDNVNLVALPGRTQLNISKIY